MTDSTKSLEKQLEIARATLERIANADSRSSDIPGGRYDRVARKALDEMDLARISNS